MTTAKDVIAEAMTWVNKKYKEGANNDSLFGRWYGANHQAWCAMFVSYVFFQAGGINLVSAQTKKGFAYCPAGVAWFQKLKQWHSARDAQPGDVVFFDWNHNGGAEHVGIVVKNDPKKQVVYTIEGNTSSGAAGSQSNGDGVYRRTRPYSFVLGVGRPAYPAPVKAPVAAPVAPVVKVDPATTAVGKKTL